MRVWEEDPHPAIHVVFRYAKQRDPKKRVEQVRAVKREWTPMMRLWLQRRKQIKPDRPNSLFGLSPPKIGLAVARLKERITGISRTPTEFRHTAAMRLVDQGATALDLAEFMMHQDIQTGQKYYAFSPTQADRINKALGLSPIYSELATIVQTGKVDKARLLALPADNQIGAAPHGIPMIGIGGCGVGQSLCARNPGISCYTCHKFMPLDEPAIHRDVQSSLRDVVQDFIAIGRDDGASPAFTQLRRTLEAIDVLIDSMDQGDG